VEGKCSTECSKMDKEYSEICERSQKSMSIFLHNPHTGDEKVLFD
jgi:hypothetical protein